MPRRDPEYSDYRTWMLSGGFGAQQASAERSYLRRIAREEGQDYSRASAKALKWALDNVFVPDRELPSRHNHRQALSRYIEFVNEQARSEDDIGAQKLIGARSLIQKRHVDKAARLIEDQGDNGLPWLYQRTGRREPRHRYVVVEDVRYPTKAFGYLVAQLAGGTTSTANVMTTEEAYAPLKKLGYVEVSGFSPKTPAQAEAAEASYYRRLARPRQAAFRRALLDAYSGACALSRTAVAGSLEAAHVSPYGTGEDTLANGVLLRADLHRLFDLGQLAFRPPALTAHFAPACLPDYEDLQDRPLRLPEGAPLPQAFKERWSGFAQAWRAASRGTGRKAES